MSFSDFDSRGYRTVDVRTGYGEWVASYEDTVRDEMDLAVLARLDVPDWAGVHRAVDLGCGTGRTGEWLRRNGVRHIDGVDLTPQMLERAAARGVHESLTEADVTDTGLRSGDYDLAIASLIDEHLPDLRPFYAEARRLVTGGGLLVLAGLHPHFIMASGMPTHFRAASGEDIAISTHLHLVGDHVSAALAAGWRLAELREAVVDDAWIAVKPKWARYRQHPVSFAYTWIAS